MKCQLLFQNTKSVPYITKAVTPIIGATIGTIVSKKTSDEFIKQNKTVNSINIIDKLEKADLSKKQKASILDTFDFDKNYNEELTKCKNYVEFLIENTDKSTYRIIQEKTGLNKFSYQFCGKGIKKNVEIEVKDNNVNIIKKTETTEKDNSIKSKTTLKNGKQIYEVLENKTLTSVIFAPNRKEERKIIYKPSKINGEYKVNVKEDNKEYVIASVIKNKNNILIEKNLTSPNGTLSIYKKQGTDDNYTLTYQIRTKNGDLILDLNRNFKKIDENITESEINGQKYINTFDFLGVESNKVDTNGNSLDKNFMIVNWRFEDILKNFPAEIFYTMQKNGVLLELNNNDGENNAFMTSDNKMLLSDGLRNDYFVFAHEIGHVKDKELGNFSDDKKLKEIFAKEKENMLANTGELTKENLEYLINNTKGLKEFFAETYAIISGLGHNGVDNPYTLRTTLLMQYFPETIAYISNRIINS